MEEINQSFNEWDEEERILKEKNPSAPRIMDKHLKETVEIEKKYKERIRQIMEGGEQNKSVVL